MLVLEPESSRGIVLFGSGAGGDPRRYRTLLDALKTNGFTVLAPTNERFDPRTVTTDQMRDRVQTLKDALSEYTHGDLPVIAAGHSVGGWAALCLAGAQPWDRDGQPLAVPVEERVTRLVLLAPTVGWFRAPGALAEVRVPVGVFAGAKDSVTPSATTELLRAAPAPMDVHVYENAGHYDFMTELPPGMTPTPGLDHAVFLHELASKITAAVG